jgi:aldose 1-epimerase
MARPRRTVRRDGGSRSSTTRATGRRKTGSAARPIPFRAEVSPDSGTGWNIVVLGYQDRRDPGRSLQARVAPEAGANLFSLQVGDLELLQQPPTLAELAEQRTGTPILYPTPNRVRDGKMVFERRTFIFPPNNQNNYIHGFARRRPWQTGSLTADARSARAELHLVWDESQPDFALFPIRHRLTVTFILRRAGLRFAYRVDNLDSSRLPFGFGLHPWFRVPGAREDVRLQVPAAHRMEARDLLPTGALIKVASTPHDLRQPRPLSELNLDDVYFGMRPGKPAWFELAQPGLRLELSGSAELTHLVVFTPPDRPVFCMENQTSSTDAHNLWSQGKKRVAHLLIVAPGKRARGHVDWTVRRPAGKR